MVHMIISFGIEAHGSTVTRESAFGPSSPIVIDAFGVSLLAAEGESVQKERLEGVIQRLCCVM